MASEFKSIPVIDISAFLAKCNDPNMINDKGVCEVVKQIDKACREAGFFYVKGHGIPDSLIKEAKDVSYNFFHLSDEEKAKINMTAETGFRGYQKVAENIIEGKAEMNEAINFFRDVKPGTYGTLGKSLEGSNICWCGDICKEFARKSVKLQFSDRRVYKPRYMHDLSRNIMKAIALALGGAPDEFGGERAGDPFWVLRLIGYPGVSDCSRLEMPENNIGCVAHTDYGGLTLLNQDDEISALQVRNCSGEWIWALPIPGTFVCNIGDMLKIWSNGLYESTLHRVINNSPKYRVSVAFFYEPNFDAVVKPLECCKEKTGGMEKFDKAVYGAHFSRKVTSIVT